MVDRAASPPPAVSPPLAPVWRRFGRTPVEYANLSDTLLAPTAVDLSAMFQREDEREREARPGE